MSLSLWQQLRTDISPRPLLILVFSLIATAYAGGTHSGTRLRAASHRTTLPFGVIDYPRPGSTVQRRAEVIGWALSEAGIREVSIYVDRNFVRNARIGGFRPDVAKVYPALKDDHSGWMIGLETMFYRPGPHELTVQATDNNGAKRDLGTITINVVRGL